MKSWERTKRGLLWRICASGWLVVGVVQADESVAKEGDELASGCFELLLVAWSLDDLGEVGLDLQFLVMCGVNARGPVDFFACREDRPRHLEFAELTGEREHVVVGGLALGHVTEPVAEGVESVEGDEVLIFEDGVDAAG